MPTMNDEQEEQGRRSSREAEIRERVEKATPGPWEDDRLQMDVESEHDKAGSPWDESGDYPEPWKSRDREVEARVCEVPAYHGDTAEGRHVHDMTFIAHSREDVPWLLAQLDSARARETALRDSLAELTDATASLRALSWPSFFSKETELRFIRAHTAAKRLLLSATAAPAEAGHEEGGAGEG